MSALTVAAPDARVLARGAVSVACMPLQLRRGERVLVRAERSGTRRVRPVSEEWLAATAIQMRDGDTACDVHLDCGELLEAVPISELRQAGLVHCI